MDSKDKDKIFRCTQCGFCCHGETTVSLDENDRERMSIALSLSRSEVAQRYWRVQDSVVQMKTVDGHCIFYDKGCTNYYGRPWRCAQWPLVPSLLTDQNNFITISDSCPGINKNLVYADFCAILVKYLEKKCEPEDFLK